MEFCELHIIATQAYFHFITSTNIHRIDLLIGMTLKNVLSTK